ncbi:MAG: hypothetical protein JWM82_4052, partial [Myxococcales bacterium]|nr:hypothetical protein [Myxococcales bacterium]
MQFTRFVWVSTLGLVAIALTPVACGGPTPSHSEMAG